MRTAPSDHSADFSVRFAENGKLKLLIIVGTRPEIIRLSAVIRTCRRCFDTILAHTGQNYDYTLNGIFFRDLAVSPPDVYLDVVGHDLGETMGHIISRSYQLMQTIRPDALLVLGDTNSCLSAISAKRLHIPIFHMEAGNRCRDERLPEETNRRIVDIISDVNLAYSDAARLNLYECGLPRERVFVTGSPMPEVLWENLAAIEANDVHTRLGLTRGAYILLSAHREENVDDADAYRTLLHAVNHMAERFDLPVLYACHPRARNRMETFGVSPGSRIMLHEPFGFHDYNCLQIHAFAVVSDSGTLPEEAAFFASVGHPYPAVSLRTSTERPEAMEKGCFVLAGIGADSLVSAVHTARTLHEDHAFGSPVPAYRDERVSAAVVRIIQSYTETVNLTVWRKKRPEMNLASPADGEV